MIAALLSSVASAAGNILGGPAGGGILGGGSRPKANLVTGSNVNTPNATTGAFQFGTGNSAEANPNISPTLTATPTASASSVDPYGELTRTPYSNPAAAGVSGELILLGAAALLLVALVRRR